MAPPHRSRLSASRIILSVEPSGRRTRTPWSLHLAGIAAPVSWQPLAAQAQTTRSEARPPPFGKRARGRASALANRCFLRSLLRFVQSCTKLYGDWIGRGQMKWPKTSSLFAASQRSLPSRPEPNGHAQTNPGRSRRRLRFYRSFSARCAAGDAVCSKVREAFALWRSVMFDLASFGSPAI